MSGWMIYWLTRLDGIKTGIEGWGIVLGFIAAGFGIASFVLYLEPNSNKPLSMKLRRWAVTIFCLVMIIITAYPLVPTTQEACVIYLLPKIANNENVQNIGDKGLLLLESKVSEWMAEQVPEQIEAVIDEVGE